MSANNISPKPETTSGIFRYQHENYFRDELIQQIILEITSKCFHMCYGDICNHHRNILNKGPCHRSSDRKTQRDTLDWTR